MQMTTCEYERSEWFLMSSDSSGSRHPFITTSTTAVSNTQIKPHAAATTQQSCLVTAGTQRANQQSQLLFSKK